MDRGATRRQTAGGGVASFGRAGAAVVAVAFMAGVSILARGRDAPPLDERPRPALRVWDVRGCYALDLGPWTPPDHAGVAAVPRTFLLLADSLDEWGRAHETYRAVPLDEVAATSPPAGGASWRAPAGEGPYRWFVRADTLWLVWTRGETLGGVALMRGAAGLAGMARVSLPSAAADMTAPARASRVNCATRRGEPERAGRR